jgi:hypothetical protein
MASAGERDENTCRKDMTIVEKLTIGQRIEELRRPEAERRQAHGATAPGRSMNASSIGGGSVSPAEKREQETAALAGHAVGLSPGSAVEQAVQQRIAAARARVARQRADRATRARRRTYGVAQRHAAKLAHLDSVTPADGTPDPQETDPC